MICSEFHTSLFSGNTGTDVKKTRALTSPPPIGDTAVHAAAAHDGFARDESIARAAARSGPSTRMLE
jgi:hypothetical protein